MVKQFRRRLLFITVFLIILLGYSAYASLIPRVRAAEPNIQDKTMAILNDVVGLNTEEYATILNPQPDNQYLSLSQKQADMRLFSNESSLRVSCSFVNNNLRQIYLSDYEGTLSVKQPAIATVDMAKGFMQRYQNYAGDSFYGELASMLDNVDVTRNITKSVGNIKLEVLNSDNTILDYVWTYTDENGIAAKSKNVILSYDQGQLKVFLNNWPLYKVVGTPKISAEEATAIALEASKNFSYKVNTDNGTVTVSGFNIAPESLVNPTLSYLNFKDQSSARGGDPFTLYPSWYVPLGFDKFYPGYVTGMTVAIWADTGEVSTMGPMVVDSPSASSTAEEAIAQGFNQESTMLAAPIVIAAVFGVVGVSLGSRKRVSKLAGSGKLFYSRFWGTMLCASILLTVILVATPTVTASPAIPNSKSRIYAALEGGGESPPQLPEEQQAAYWVCGQIEDAFEASGYSASNLAGSGTTKQDILSQAQTDQTNYDRVAVFHFGHLAGFQVGYVDNDGQPVLHTDIRTQTANRKHAFVFIWACAQANHHAWGTPAAWTHRGNQTLYPPYHLPFLSDNGYTNPDGLGQCYIGFYNFSPQIGNNTRTFEQQMTGPVKYFINYFYDYALRYDSLQSNYAVRDALNLASCYFFGYTFTSSILNTGYDAWWIGDPRFEYPYNQSGYVYGRMRVFGDGAIWLYQPKITLAANYGLSPTFYLDGEQRSLGDVYTYARVYTVGVSDIPNYSFDHFYYPNGGSYTSNPTPMPLIIDGALTAYYVWDPAYYTLTISGGGGGYTTPSSGAHQYSPGTPVTVNAYAYNDFYFDHWTLDGNNAGSDPTKIVTMNSDHYLQAHFVYDPPPPPPPGTLTVLGRDHYNNEQYIQTNIYIDSQWVGTTDSAFYAPGSHTIEVDSVVDGYWYFYYYYIEGYDYDFNNPTEITVDPSLTITAMYQT